MDGYRLVASLTLLVVWAFLSVSDWPERLGIEGPTGLVLTYGVAASTVLFVFFLSNFVSGYRNA